MLSRCDPRPINGLHNDKVWAASWISKPKIHELDWSSEYHPPIRGYAIDIITYESFREHDLVSRIDVARL